MFRFWSILFLFLMCYACGITSSGLRCPDGKAIKARKYKVKKVKRALSYYPPTNDSASSPKRKTKTTETATKKTESEQSTASKIVGVEGSQARSTEAKEQYANIGKISPIEIRVQTKDSVIAIATSATISAKDSLAISGNSIAQKANKSDENINHAPSNNSPQSIKGQIQFKEQSRVTNNNAIEEIKPIKHVQENIKLDIVIPAKFNYDPESQFVFKNLVYDKDKEFEYVEIIEFVPNFSILMYPDQASKELDSLVKLLQEFPEKKVKLYGNGGWEGGENMASFELNYQQVTNGEITDFVRINYGSNHRVYDQLLYNLGNEDPYHLMRIKEEGLKEIGPFQGLEVGQLLKDRAREIKELLVSKGIDPNRIKCYRGEFVPYTNHTVNIKVSD